MEFSFEPSSGNANLVGYSMEILSSVSVSKVVAESIGCTSGILSCCWKGDDNNKCDAFGEGSNFIPSKIEAASRKPDRPNLRDCGCFFSGGTSRFGSGWR